MWPDRVWNPGPLAHESDALPTALRGPAERVSACMCVCAICNNTSYICNNICKLHVQRMDKSVC